MAKLTIIGVDANIPLITDYSTTKQYKVSYESDEKGLCNAKIIYNEESYRLRKDTSPFDTTDEIIHISNDLSKIGRYPYLVIDCNVNTLVLKNIKIEETFICGDISILICEDDNKTNIDLNGTISYIRLLSSAHDTRIRQISKEQDITLHIPTANGIHLLNQEKEHCIKTLIINFDTVLHTSPNIETVIYNNLTYLEIDPFQLLIYCPKLKTVKIYATERLERGYTLEGLTNKLKSFANYAKLIEKGVCIDILP